MKLHNYMENVVSGTLESLFPCREDLCSCDKCKLDIVALALNNLSPKYVVTNKGIIYARLAELEAQCKADVVKEITKAVEIIKANPRH